ncbi:MAG: hypothetical protein HS107_07765 [Thermoflexaceae bacterium]|nr:hypothetical protein [Thermoflexaceae bacterium]
MGSSLPTGAPGTLVRCERCGAHYDWRKSSSWTLKMTYCSALCEQGDLGFSIETLLRGTMVMRSAWRDLLVS